MSLRLADGGWLIACVTRGLLELARARLQFDRLRASEIPQRNHASAAAARSVPEAEAGRLATRIGFVLPRIAARLPWRSDCLIQAIAGQNWLAARGIPSEIRIGVEKSGPAGFGAHAWLVQGDRIVTGGDIARYHVLLTEEHSAAPAKRGNSPASGNNA